VSRFAGPAQCATDAVNEDADGSEPTGRAIRRYVIVPETGATTRATETFTGESKAEGTAAFNLPAIRFEYEAMPMGSLVVFLRASRTLSAKGSVKKSEPLWSSIEDANETATALEVGLGSRLLVGALPHALGVEALRQASCRRQIRNKVPRAQNPKPARKKPLTSCGCHAALASLR